MIKIFTKPVKYLTKEMKPAYIHQQANKVVPRSGECSRAEFSR